MLSPQYFTAGIHSHYNCLSVDTYAASFIETLQDNRNFCSSVYSSLYTSLFSLKFALTAIHEDATLHI